MLFGYLVLFAVAIRSYLRLAVGYLNGCFLLPCVAIAFFCYLLLSGAVFGCLVLAIFFAVAYCCCLLLAVIYCRFLLPGARVS